MLLTVRRLLVFFYGRPFANKLLQYGVGYICGEGSVWLNGALVCLLITPRVHLSVSVDNGWPVGHTMRPSTIIHYNQLPLSEIVKRRRLRV